MERHERLAIFFERLRAAPPMRSADDALAFVCRLIEEVEDEFCPVARQHPPPLSASGRMYAPQSDLIFSQEDGSIRAETRRHVMRFLTDGSIHITSLAEPGFEFFKSGGTL